MANSPHEAKALTALGLTRDSTLGELKARGDKLAQTMHPDKGGDPKEFAMMRQAYKVCKGILPKHHKCTECKGEGRTKLSNGFNSMWMKCKTCRGKGR